MRALANHISWTWAMCRNAALLAIAATFVPSTLAYAENIKVIGDPGQLLSGCPVEMAAQQQSASTLREVPGGFSGSRHALRQGVTLTLTGRNKLVVTDAEIVVHGLSPTPRAISANGGLANGEADADVTRTFRLRSITASEFRSDVWMAGVSALRWIEVKSITYSDGTVWRESKQAKCGIAPDPHVLVSAR